MLMVYSDGNLTKLKIWLNWSNLTEKSAKAGKRETKGRHSFAMSSDDIWTNSDPCHPAKNWFPDPKSLHSHLYPGTVHYYILDKVHTLYLI